MSKYICGQNKILLTILGQKIFLVNNFKVKKLFKRFGLGKNLDVKILFGSRSFGSIIFLSELYRAVVSFVR